MWSMRVVRIVRKGQATDKSCNYLPVIYTREMTTRKLVSVPEQHHPTPEERDERVTLPWPAEAAIEAILKAGPHPNGATGKTADEADPADK